MPDVSPPVRNNSAAESRTVAVFVNSGATEGIAAGTSGRPHRFNRNAAASPQNRNESPTSAVRFLDSAFIYRLPKCSDPSLPANRVLAKAHPFFASHPTVYGDCQNRLSI